MLFRNRRMDVRRWLFTNCWLLTNCLTVRIGEVEEHGEDVILTVDPRQTVNVWVVEVDTRVGPQSHIDVLCREMILHSFHHYSKWHIFMFVTSTHRGTPDDWRGTRNGPEPVDHEEFGRVTRTQNPGPTTREKSGRVLLSTEEVEGRNSRGGKLR